MIVVLLGILFLSFPKLSMSEDRDEDKEVHHVGEVQVTAPGAKENLKVDIPVGKSTYQVGATAVDVWIPCPVLISADRVWGPRMVQW